MNTSVKNPKTALIKKALMALTVVLAIGFSAFTNAHKTVNNAKFKKHSGMIADGFIAQTAAGSEFQELASVDPDNCSTTPTSYPCSYTVTSAGADNIPDKPDGYTAADINSYLGHTPAWLNANGSTNRVYNP